MPSKEKYSVPFKASKVDLFARVANGIKVLTILVKSTISDE